jgi:serralysin
MSVSTPWDLPTAAAYSAPAGTCINLSTGVYPINTLGPLTISHGGTGPTKTGYVVWRCLSMPFSFSGGVLQGEGLGCVLRDTGGAQHDVAHTSSTTGASYVMFDALEFDGNLADGFVCLGIGDGTGRNYGHHIWVINSDMHGCGQSGLQWNNTDWLFALDNVFHDNAWSTACGCYGSGLSIYEPVGLTGYSSTSGNPDYWHSATSGLTYNIVIAYNVTYHNYNQQSGTSNTDGNGIILDDWQHGQNSCPGSGTCPFTGNTLVMGNVIYDNGGAGISSNSLNSGSITIVNNTIYFNSWDTHDSGTYRPGISNAGNQKTLTINNISYADGVVNGTQAQPYLGVCGIASCPSNVWQTNLSYPGSDNNFDGSYNVYSTVGINHNLDGSDPKFITASTSIPNFALQGSSPAIGFGQAFDLWQQSGTVDAGACVSSLTSCP